MRLSELIALRPVPAAGLLVMLTRSCPLSCAHCSTSALRRDADAPADGLRALVRSFTPGDRPELMLLTGGEPLLRPTLAAELAATARRSGTRTALLSGMFFARGGALPPVIRRTVRALDHFSASVDEYHEREVPRRDVFHALRQIRELGVPVSLHITGRSAADPYLAELTAAVRAEFGDRVPMLVTTVRPVGRAASWAAATAATGGGSTGDGTAEGTPVPPCPMAAWPVAAVDGTVLACCNQLTVDRRPVPAHLRLGRIGRDPWPRLRRRAVRSPVLRVLRTEGPGPDGCAGCRALAADPPALAAAVRTGSGPAAALLDQESGRLQRTAGPEALLRRYACPPFAPLALIDGGPP
jgi:pyruvate-formate lyase-activating enzyme